MQILCFFHAHCSDGHAAAAVIRRAEPGAECRPARYDRPPEGLLGRRVYVVDCGYPLAVMQRLSREAAELIWIDHHASFDAVRAALGWGIAGADCAAGLCWEHCFPDEPEPSILAYVRDHDLGRWQLPDSHAVAAGLRQAFSDHCLDGLLESEPAALARLGAPIWAHQQQELGRALRNGVVSSDPYGQFGRRALVCAQASMVSELGQAVCAEHGYDLLIAYHHNARGRFVHNLRSAGTIDCRAIAEARGGGGHARAAAYEAQEPFPLSQDCLDWPA